MLPLAFASSSFVEIPANIYNTLPFCDNSTLPMTTATVVEYVTVMPEAYKTSQQPSAQTGQVSGQIHASTTGLVSLVGISFLMLQM
jgi:hypothetical protein